MDSVVGVQQLAEAAVMVQGGDDEGDILAHIRFHEPFGFEQFRLPVGEVGGDHPVDETVPVSFLKGVDSVGEQGESTAGENPVGLPLFQLPGQVDNALSAGDHIVRHKDVLPLNVITQVLVGNDGVAAVDDAGIVAAFVEQAQVKAQDGGVENVAVDGAFIRGDDHHVLLVDPQGFIPLEERLEDLVTGHNAFKTGGGDGVLDPGIVGVEGDDIADPHILQFLQRHGAVQALTGGTAVLPAFIQHGHDDRDPLGLAAHGGDDPLQVGKMFVRAHGNGLPEHFIGNIVGTGITEDIHIVSADTFLDHAFAFTVSETGKTDVDQEVLALCTGGGAHVAGHGFLGVILPLFQPAVDFYAHLLGSGHGDEPKRTNRISQK